MKYADKMMCTYDFPIMRAFHELRTKRGIETQGSCRLLVMLL